MAEFYFIKKIRTPNHRHERNQKEKQGRIAEQRTGKEELGQDQGSDQVNVLNGSWGNPRVRA